MKVNTMFEEHAAYYGAGMVLLLTQLVIVVMLLAQRRQKSTIEKALRANEATYRLLAENVTDIIWTVDRHLRMTYISPSLEKMTGWTPQEWLARNSLAFLTPHSQAIVRKIFDKEARLACQAGYDWSRTIVFEAEHSRKDGTTFWVEITGRLMRSAEGEIMGAIGVTRDITDRKQTEASLREWKRRYDLIVAASGQVVYDYDVPAGTIIWGNTMESVLGYPRIEISQGFQQWVDLLHPDDRAKTLEALKKAEIACTYWDAEYRMQHKDGHYVWIRDRGFFLPDPAGKAARQLGMLEDVTERKYAEEALRESETKFRTIFENAPVAIVINRLYERTILEVNRKFEEQIGVSRATALGKTIQNLTQYVDPADTDRLREEYLQHGRVDNYHLRTYHHTGYIQHLLVSIYPITWVGEPCTVTMSTDITALKQAEETLRESEAKFHTIFENAPTSIVISRLRDRAVIDVNRKFETAAGLPRAAIIGRKSFESVQGIDLSDVKRMIQAMMLRVNLIRSM